MVVSIPQTILAEMELIEGDRVLVQATSPSRLVITKETSAMPNSQRVELELAVLEARVDALNAESESLVWQHNNGMELNLALTDQSAFTLTMIEQTRKSAELQVEIARKRLELFEVKGVVPGPRTGAQIDSTVTLPMHHEDLALFAAELKAEGLGFRV